MSFVQTKLVGGTQEKPGPPEASREVGGWAGDTHETEQSKTAKGYAVMAETIELT